ncbi:MAG: hypothetical protein D6785_07880, partial [Planctomycetota bacterium]
YEIQKKWVPALIEYGKAAQRFPTSPYPLLAIGDCYRQLGQNGEAKKAYQKSFFLFKQHKTRPPSSLYVYYGSLLEKEKLYPKALNLYFDYFINYKKSSFHRMKAHILLARLLATNKSALSLAFSHNIIAKSIYPGHKLLNLLPKLSKSSLLPKDFAKMLRLGYPSSLMVEMALKGPLGFVIKTKKDIAFLQKTYKLPFPVILALILRSKKLIAEKAKINPLKTLPDRKTGKKIPTSKLFKVKILHFRTTPKYWSLKYEIQNLTPKKYKWVKISFVLKDKNKRLLRTWTRFKGPIFPSKAQSLYEFWKISDYPQSYYINLAILDYAEADSQEKPKGKIAIEKFYLSKDKKYFHLKFKVKNTGSSQIDFMKIQFQIKDQQNKKLRTWVRYYYYQIQPGKEKLLWETWAVKTYPNTRFVDIQILSLQ